MDLKYFAWRQSQPTVLWTNAENWTGRQVEYKILKSELKDGVRVIRFEVYDYRFELEITNMNIYTSPYQYGKCYMFFAHNGRRNPYPICKGVKWPEEPEWEMFHGDIKEGNLSRSAQNPLVAAVKVIANVL